MPPFGLKFEPYRVIVRDSSEGVYAGERDETMGVLSAS
jgi:hypothetical protein